MQRYVPILSAGRVRHCLAWWVLAWLLAACAASPLTELRDIGGEIQARYEERLSTLSPGKQRHYAQRLYRITGNVKYVPANVDYAARLALELQRDIAGLALEGYPMARSRAIMEAYPTRTEKQRRRKALLARWGEIPFARQLLFRLAQANDYRLLGTPPFAGHERALDYLAGVDFRRFLLAPDVLDIYAAQVANAVYYLHDLGITDLRDAFATAMRTRYPAQQDDALSNAGFRNKIYGLTHLVIAASGYYQHPVNAEEVEWVLDYFSANIDPIIARTKADIFTEVGISFELAGRGDDPAVARIKQALRERYDPQARMIPAEDGGTELEFGEHRNVLAIMLFQWPDRLYSGPDLSGHALFRPWPTPQVTGHDQDQHRQKVAALGSN
ncbi:DUF3541 domain-containing protein [Modicisalibacter xianhensis]|uniref:DUF3541 domain-containing protein n=1 Tax=Modicisalibacter xianhensis TaxID=442341 RepID=A0A1I2YQV2_9GAMM|nr:DUF3541 domain-containing protein [Halomonas xianhensis]SFH27987.1 protein of unknown function [Halomonas xianhensis]